MPNTIKLEIGQQFASKYCGTLTYIGLHDNHFRHHANLFYAPNCARATRSEPEFVHVFHYENSFIRSEVDFDIETLSDPIGFTPDLTPMMADFNKSMFFHKIVGIDWKPATEGYAGCMFRKVVNEDGTILVQRARQEKSPRGYDLGTLNFYHSEHGFLLGIQDHFEFETLPSVDSLEGFGEMKFMLETGEETTRFHWK